MRALNALLVDDEHLARKRLARLLKAHAHTVNIAGQAGNAQEGIEAIGALQPDLLFLDIQMPGMDAFEMLSRLPQRPQVVFTTAYADYAVRAFEEHALDYLLKPIEPDRLATTVERVQRRSRSEDTLSPDLLQRVAALVQPERSALSIPVKVGDRYVFVPLDTVTHFEARDKYVYVHTTQGKEYLIDQPLVALTSKLPSRFVQVHRACIVNRDKIREVFPYFNSRYVLHLGEPPCIKITTGPSFARVIQETLTL